MALLLKCGAVFLHIPKTGGSWVTAVLEQQGLVQRRIGHIHANLHQVLRYLNPAATIYHEVLSQIKPYFSLAFKQRFNPQKETNQAIWHGKLPEKDTTPFIFCFVRHPISWYNSIWRYMYQHNWPMFGRQYDIIRWHPLAVMNRLGDNDINQFLRNIIRHRPGFLTELYGWYTLPGINFIGKQENLVDDLVEVLNTIGVKFDEQKIRAHEKMNVSSIPGLPELDKVLRNEIVGLEKVALRRYGYEE